MMCNKIMILCIVSLCHFYDFLRICKQFLFHLYFIDDELLMHGVGMKLLNLTVFRMTEPASTRDHLGRCTSVFSDSLQLLDPLKQMMSLCPAFMVFH